MPVKSTIEFVLTELSELKTSKKTDKQYFMVNGKDYVCYDKNILAVLSNMEGKTIRANITTWENGGVQINNLELNNPTPTPQTIAKAPPCPPQTATAPSQHLSQAVKTLNNGDEKTRAVALSYGKDLCAAGKIKLDEIFITADSFIDYILKK